VGTQEMVITPVGRIPDDSYDKEVSLLHRKLQTREIAIKGLAMELMDF
jgi:hypothetical protein